MEEVFHICFLSAKHSQWYLYYCELCWLMKMIVVAYGFVCLSFSSKAVVESPADKRKAKAAPVSPSKAATSPKPAILSKTSKVTKAAANGTPG